MAESKRRCIFMREVRLDEKVNFDRLAEADLTGGEIKNAVLNGARIIAARGEKAKVKMSDFARAVSMEADGKWSEQGSKEGFIS